jgi:hypothetical protein
MEEIEKVLKRNMEVLLQAIEDIEGIAAKAGEKEAVETENIVWIYDNIVKYTGRLLTVIEELQSRVPSRISNSMVEEITDRLSIRRESLRHILLSELMATRSLYGIVRDALQAEEIIVSASID